MDRIMARGMTFRACHGVLAAEKIEPQIFKVDVELFLDTSRAGVSDDLKDTVSYADVFAQVQKIVENERFHLLEALAENIATSLLLRFPIIGVELTVYKPNAPVDGNFDYFAVCIKRFQK